MTDDKAHKLAEKIADDLLTYGSVRDNAYPSFVAIIYSHLRPAKQTKVKGYCNSCGHGNGRHYQQCPKRKKKQA